MHLCGSLNILWDCLSLELEWKLTFSSSVATAEFSKFASILNIALSQHHLLEFEIALPPTSPLKWREWGYFKKTSWKSWSTVLFFRVDRPFPNILSPVFLGDRRTDMATILVIYKLTQKTCSLSHFSGSDIWVQFSRVALAQAAVRVISEGLTGIIYFHTFSCGHW